jgi:hypothetical protein
MPMGSLISRIDKSPSLQCSNDVPQAHQPTSERFGIASMTTTLGRGQASTCMYAYTIAHRGADGGPLSIAQPRSPVIAWPADGNAAGNEMAHFFRCGAPPYKSVA